MPDSALVTRLESLVAAERLAVCRIAQELYPDAGVSCERIGETVALFAGTAIGLSTVSCVPGHLPLDPATLNALEEFLARVGDGPAEVSVHGQVHPGLAEQIAGFGLDAEEIEDVLVMDLGSSAALPQVSECHEVSIAGADRIEEWALLVASGFNEGRVPPEPDVRFARCIARRPGVAMFWATIDGRPGAAGELWIGDDIAWLSADSTLPRYRSRGLQYALQLARVSAAYDAGCRVAATEASPGSSSHRNARRAGFRPLYSRTVYSRGRS